MKKLNISKQFLIKEYSEKENSQEKVATKLGCCQGTVFNYLKIYNVPTRSSSETRVKCKIPKSFLIKEYIKNKNTSCKIADEFKCSITFIKNKLKKYNIPMRTKSESRKGIKFSDVHKQNIAKTKKGIKRPLFSIEWKQNMSLAKQGKNNSNWQNGISKLPYAFEFTSELKEQIRKRDNHKCQLCGMTEEEHLVIYGKKLTVHHIDYNKENCSKDNLISLCSKCNPKVNGNRNYYYAYFTYIMENWK